MFLTSSARPFTTDVPCLSHLRLVTVRLEGNAGAADCAGKFRTLRGAEHDRPVIDQIVDRKGVRMVKHRRHARPHRGQSQRTNRIGDRSASGGRRPERLCSNTSSNMIAPCRGCDRPAAGLRSPRYRRHTARTGIGCAAGRFGFGTRRASAGRAVTARISAGAAVSSWATRRVLTPAVGLGTAAEGPVVPG